MKKKTNPKSKKARNNTTRLHPETGRPRHWICYNHAWYDDILRELEWMYSSEKSMVAKDYLRMEKTFRMAAGAMRWRAELHRMAISPSELNYCTAEGIDPDSFKPAVVNSYEHEQACKWVCDLAHKAYGEVDGMIADRIKAAIAGESEPGGDSSESE